MPKERAKKNTTKGSQLFSYVKEAIENDYSPLQIIKQLKELNYTEEAFILFYAGLTQGDITDKDCKAAMEELQEQLDEELEPKYTIPPRYSFLYRGTQLTPIQELDEEAECTTSLKQ